MVSLFDSHPSLSFPYFFFFFFQLSANILISWPKKKQVVTPPFRAFDGDSKAADLLIRRIDSVDRMAQVSVCVYSEDADKGHGHLRRRRVIVTSDMAQLRDWIVRFVRADDSGRQ